MDRWLDFILTIATFFYTYMVGWWVGSGTITQPVSWFVMGTIGIWVGFAIRTRWSD